jgi:hypothetical protein
MGGSSFCLLDAQHSLSTLLSSLQVILYPQSGGFLERGEASAPSGQLEAGCFDGYGQTREDYAFSSGPQMQVLRNMIRALTQ